MLSKQHALRRAREVAGRAERLSKLSVYFGEEAERLADEAAQCLRHARSVCARAKACADEAVRLLTAVEGPSEPCRALQTAARRTILLIDDDDAAKAALALTLRLEGYQVRTAVTSASGWDEAQTGLDAIIIDYHLPNVDGLRLLRDLREKRHSRTPIAIVTGDNCMDEGVSRELSDLGAQVWLKPIWGAELVKRLGRLMSVSN
jgi:CheY-like chemotaxis protein